MKSTKTSVNLLCCVIGGGKQSSFLIFSLQKLLMISLLPTSLHSSTVLRASTISPLPPHLSSTHSEVQSSHSFLLLLGSALTKLCVSGSTFQLGYLLCQYFLQDSSASVQWNHLFSFPSTWK